MSFSTLSQLACGAPLRSNTDFLVVECTGRVLQLAHSGAPHSKAVLVSSSNTRFLFDPASQEKSTRQRHHELIQPPCLTFRIDLHTWHGRLGNQMRQVMVTVAMIAKTMLVGGHVHVDHDDHCCTKLLVFQGVLWSSRCSCLLLDWVARPCMVSLW